MESRSVARAALVIKTGPQTGRAFELGGQALVIGRVKPCDVVLASSGVSRKHARLDCTDDGFILEDLGSLNGTFVNGQRLHAPRRLENEDCIQIHDTLLSFAAAIPARNARDVAAARQQSHTPSVHTSVVAALDVRVGALSRVEVNAEIKLQALLDIIRSVGAAGDIDQTLSAVLDHVFEIFPQADHGFVLLNDSDRRLAPRAVKHRLADAAERTLGPINNRVAQQAMDQQHAILSADVAGDDAIGQGQTIFDVQLRAVMCAPLITPIAGALGVLQLVTEDAQRQFDQSDLDVMASIGLLAGQLVEHARHHERKGAADALRRSESRFRALVEKSRDSIAILDRQGTVVFATGGVAQQLGYPAGDSLGRSAYERVHPEDAARIGPVFAELLAEPGGARTVEFRVQHADGSWPWLEATGRNLLHDPDVGGIVCNYRDITQRRQIEQQRLQLLEDERRAREVAERVSCMKDEFLATLSHELRTPLNAIVGWADLLQTGKLGTADVAQGIETIRRNARMQTQIIEDLLDMSRIVSGRIRLEMQPVDVERLLLAAVETVRPAAQAKQVRLELQCASDCPPLHADPARLQQVLWNLLSNAIKFTPPQGRVTVAAQSADGELEIRVTDSGEGIPGDFLPYVFERFRQADSSSTRRHGGLGLGLAIVKQLVELHGGSIGASSPGPQQGATFTVRLPGMLAAPAPRQAEARQVATAAPADEVSLQGVAVLIVDDEQDARDLARRMLADAGASVRCADSAAQALELLKQSPPAVLLADIAMPVMDGYDLLRAVRALSPQAGGTVPAVAVTAFAHAESRRRSFAAGFQHHLTKPLKRSELLSVVAMLAPSANGSDKT